MALEAVELVLTRQLASCLAMPIFVVDPRGNLIYYNESAEALLGSRFDETGELSLEGWATVFEPTDSDGRGIAMEGLPLVIALRERRPARREMWIRGLDGVRRHLAVTALPLVVETDRFLGALSMFWELEAP